MGKNLHKMLLKSKQLNKNLQDLHLYSQLQHSIILNKRTRETFFKVKIFQGIHRVVSSHHIRHLLCQCHKIIPCFLDNNNLYNTLEFLFLFIQCLKQQQLVLLIYSSNSLLYITHKCKWTIMALRIYQVSSFFQISVKKLQSITYFACSIYMEMFLRSKYSKSRKNKP